MVEPPVVRRSRGKASPVSRRPAAAAILLLVATLLGSLLVVSPAQARSLPTKERWLADTRQAMYGSRTYVQQRAAQGGTKLAVNFDIDNTSLATYYARGTAVPVVLRFARYARTQGVTLLFNTGRERGHLAGVRASLR